MHPISEKFVHDNQLIRNGQPKEAALTRLKIEQDIAFLADRVNIMKRQSKPPVQLIAYYETMLRSRESVLKWWLDGCDADENTVSLHQKPNDFSA